MRTLAIIILLTISANVFGQLNKQSKAIKTKAPETYEFIKASAIEEWEDNHEMIVYHINEQADALFEYIKIAKDEANYDKDVMFKALVEWKDDDYDILSEMKKGTPTVKLHVDWKMVIYTYKNQLEAKSQY